MHRGMELYGYCNVQFLFQTDTQYDFYKLVFDTHNNTAIKYAVTFMNARTHNCC